MEDGERKEGVRHLVSKLGASILNFTCVYCNFFLRLQHISFLYFSVFGYQHISIL